MDEPTFINYKLSIYFVDSNQQNIIGPGNRYETASRKDSGYDWEYIDWREDSLGKRFDYVYAFGGFGTGPEQRQSLVRFGTDVDTMLVKMNFNEDVQFYWNSKLASVFPAKRPTHIVFIEK